ncbi:MAG: hypothetical protein L0Y44_13855 [Phycisphaerales bacterium]|nr:hypothetical protein [Phycisphaerales bacterium]MCI0631729.1 hypothetical protein [Phycisphaerales bacterium]
MIVWLLMGAIVNVAVACGIARLFRGSVHSRQGANTAQELPGVELRGVGVRRHVEIRVIEGPDLQFETIVIHEAGWPLLCLRRSDTTLAMISSMPREYRLTTPIWRGLAINTILYAAMLWLLFAGPGFVRRRVRIKRGLCPACAYPVGESATCTECGHTFETKSAG